MIHPDITSDSSKDSFFTGDPNQVLDLGNELDSEMHANLVLPINGISIPSPTCTIISDIDAIQLLFEDFFMNDVNISTNDKNWYILCAFLGVVEGFSMDDSPYKDLKKPMLPTQHMFKQEVVWHLPQSKIRKLENLELIALLQLEEYKL